MDTVRELLTTVFGGVWHLMSSITVPGFGVSVAKVTIGFFVIKWSLNILGLITGFRTNAESAAVGLRSSTESAHHYREKYAQHMNEAQRRSASLKKWS